MPTTISPSLSRKIRFFSLLSMVLLVYVHGYDLEQRYLQPYTLVEERLSFTTFTQYLLANGLFRFRLPVLFIISAYLLAMRPPAPHGPLVRRRVRTLLVPFVLWSGIALLTTWGLEHWALTAPGIEAARLTWYGDGLISRATWGQRLSIWLLEPVAFQLWFLRSLFVYIAAYPLLRRAVVARPRVTFAIATLFWLADFGIPLLFGGEGLLAFLIGIWLGVRGADVETRPSWVRLGPLTIVWLTAAACKTYLAFQGVSEFVTPMVLLHKLVVASGMLVMWYGIDGLVTRAMDNRAFAWVSGFSFIIYAAHVPVINYALFWIFPLVEHLPGYRMAVFVLLPLLVMAGSVLVGATLRRFTPRAYGWLTGGRGGMSGELSAAPATPSRYGPPLQTPAS
ncbi:MAG: acyltransferase [Gemmatimonadaceae bacterium]|nr:acyltransferase [Gemmatimonadaceae bacterium]